MELLTSEPMPARTRASASVPAATTNEKLRRHHGAGPVRPLWSTARPRTPCHTSSRPLHSSRMPKTTATTMEAMSGQVSARTPSTTSAAPRRAAVMRPGPCSRAARTSETTPSTSSAPATDPDQDDDGAARPQQDRDRRERVRRCRQQVDRPAGRLDLGERGGRHDEQADDHQHQQQRERGERPEEQRPAHDDGEDADDHRQDPCTCHSRLPPPAPTPVETGEG